jgi:hypothetical protein
MADAHEFRGVGMDFPHVPGGKIRGQTGEQFAGGWGQGDLVADIFPYLCTKAA